MPIGTLIRTFETTSPIRRSPHQCPASRLFVESTRALRKHVWDLHVRRRGVNDSMRIVAEAVRRTRGVRRRKMEQFNTSSPMEQVLGALRSHPAVQRRKLKSTGHPRRSLHISFSGPEPDRPGRNPSLVTMWQATPSSVILERIVIIRCLKDISKNI